MHCWLNTNKNLKIVFAITDEDGEKQSSTSSSWTTTLSGRGNS